MSFNKELMQTDLDQVTKELMQKAFWLALRDGVTSTAPLGFSGDSILLFGDNRDPVTDTRKSCISFRMYCDDVELLITDIKGNFLFYGSYRKEIGVEVVLEEYWRMFNLVKPFILTELPRGKEYLKISPNVEYTIGWKLLNSEIPAKFKPMLEKPKNKLIIFIQNFATKVKTLIFKC